MYSCKKDELQPGHFEILTENVLKGAKTIDITCNYIYPVTINSVDGIISKNIDMNNATRVRANIVGKSFSVRFQNLEANTTYYYQYEYSNNIDVIKTEVKSIKTNAFGLPTVKTNAIDILTAATSISGGEVIDDGGYNVTARGVCWSTSEDPTINESHTIDGTGTGYFLSYINCQTVNAVYYVRAYATNSKGTSYGNQEAYFAGCSFSVSANRKVYFSQGNLQYKASSKTWRFAKNQWDYVGGTYYGNNYGTVFANGVQCDNTLISSTYNGWIDLFGWGTSGYNHGAINYRPWDTDGTGSVAYCAYGNKDSDLSSHTGKADWGYNAISNGGKAENLWRTLTSSEWKYVFDNRKTSSEIRYAKAKVNDINGVILLPDNWNQNIYDLKKTNSAQAHYNSNVIDATVWANTLEANGAIFLPAAGYRKRTSLSLVGSNGYYWSATHRYSSSAYHVYINEESLHDTYESRYIGYSVRLVRNAN